MHIQSRQMKLNPVNPYSAAAEWAIAGQQIADGSKNLIKSAKGVEGISSPEEASLLAKWMDTGYSNALTVVECHTPDAGKESSLG
jgi:hypothetical protein